MIHRFLVSTASLFMLNPVFGFNDRDKIHLQIITVRTQNDSIQVLSQLRSGVSFSELARRYSTDPTSANGGYLGELGPGQLNHRLRRETENLAEGAVVDFFDPELGYTILRKLEPGSANQEYAKQAVRRGIGHLRENRISQAISEFKRALARDPQSSEAHLNLGYAYRLLASYEMLGEAKAEFQQALAFDPGSAAARMHLAEIYIDLGLPRKAKELLEARLEVTDRTPELLALLGDVSRQLGDASLSVEQNKKALEMSPSLAMAHHNLGRAYLDLKQKKEAIHHLDIAVVSKNASSDMYLTAGLAHLEQGNLDIGVSLLGKAVELNPTLPEAHLKLARAYRLKGSIDSALEQLKVALSQAKPFSASAHYAEFQTELYYETGLAFRAKGQLVEAIEAFRQALAVSPEHAQSHQGLSEAYYRKGDYDRSLEHALKAKELGVAIEHSLFKAIVEKARK
ncbi:MAG: tetratricopeptide repeat protein [Acidobacteria bacterium]|nr:tetratricopeptide repeat protein [Acidobacteriota bacterium]